MKKVLQRFNINDDTKSVSTPLAPHFKLKITMSPITVEEREYMTHVLYASAVGSLMYAMECTRPDLLQAVSMVSIYMHDPDRGHWEALKWVLRYIKGTIDVGLIFEKDVMGKQECIRYVDSDTQEISTNDGEQQDMCLHCLKHRSAGSLLYSLLSHCLLQRPSIWP